MIEIMNLHNEKPSEPYDFKVDRSSVLGNPFVMLWEYNRDAVCDDYVEWIYKQIDRCEAYYTKELNKMYLAYVQYGKLRLFCWCAPKRCHAETIREILLDWDSL